jgi:hypothetical protein
MQLRRNQRQDGTPNDLFGLVTEHASRGGIPRSDDAGQVLGNDSVVGRFDDSSEAEARFVEAHTITDLASNRRDADHAAIGIADRRHRDGNVDATAVFVQALRFGVPDMLAGADAFEIAEFRGLQVTRHQDEDRLANDLVSRVSEDPLCGGIPSDDRAIGVLADNRVLRRLYDRCHANCQVCAADRLQSQHIPEGRFLCLCTHPVVLNISYRCATKSLLTLVVHAVRETAHECQGSSERVRCQATPDALPSC